MKRVSVSLRDDADKKAYDSGVFKIERSLPNGDVYKTWDESSAYIITKNEVDTILDKVSNIVEMGRNAVDFLLDGEWGTLGLPLPIFEYARNSFDDQEIELFTRYDFAYLGNGQIKLVNIDADAPSFLVETAETQRKWVWDKFAQKAQQHKITQINSIPEMTKSAFRQLYDMSSEGNFHILDNETTRGKEWFSSSYIKNLAEKSGWDIGRVRLKDLSWEENQKRWEDHAENQIAGIYKQLPWDMLFDHMLMREIVAHSQNLERIFEPAWKTVLASRAILPALHELYSRSALISPASLARSKKLGTDIVSAPMLRSASKNEMALLKGRRFTSWGEELKDFRNQKSMVYRKLEVPKRFKDKNGDGQFTYISIFTVAGNIAGLGIQETKLPLLGQHSTFKPHIVML